MVDETLHRSDWSDILKDRQPPKKLTVDARSTYHYELKPLLTNLIINYQDEIIVKVRNWPNAKCAVDTALSLGRIGSC